MALQQIMQGQASSPNDVDQLVTELNGGAASAMLVSNRIQAAIPPLSLSTTGALIGGTFTKGDKSQIKPLLPNSTIKPGSPSSAGTSYVKGDMATDQAGIHWIATGATSGGVTPWIGVGKGGDTARVRGTLYDPSYPNDTTFDAAINFATRDFGSIQWTTHHGFTWLVPTSGYYHLTFSIKAFALTGWMEAQIFQHVDNQPDISLSHGDRVPSDSGPSANAGAMAEDILYLTAGTYVGPWLANSGAGFLTPSEVVPNDRVVYMTLELLCASASS
jgi:hypothetical protein